MTKIEMNIKIELDRKDLTLYELDESGVPNENINKTHEQVISDLKSNLKKYFESQIKIYFEDYAHEEIECDEDFPIFDPEEITFKIVI